MQRGPGARASGATLSEGLPVATPAPKARFILSGCCKQPAEGGRTDFGPLLRCSSVTMLWHGSLLASCTGPKSAPSRWANVGGFGSWRHYVRLSRRWPGHGARADWALRRKRRRKAPQ